MPVCFSLRALLGAGLLLAAGSCQRASYQACQLTPATLAGVVLPPSSPVAPVPGSRLPAPVAGVASRAASRLVLHRLHRQLSHPPRPAATGAAPPPAQLATRRPAAWLARARAVSRRAPQQPALSEDTWAYLVLIGLAVGALVGGVLLLLLGGWLATTGGVLLLLLAAALGLFTLFVSQYGKGGNH